MQRPWFVSISEQIAAFLFVPQAQERRCESFPLMVFRPSIAAGLCFHPFTLLEETIHGSAH